MCLPRKGPYFLPQVEEKRVITLGPELLSSGLSSEEAEGPRGGERRAPIRGECPARSCPPAAVSGESSHGDGAVLSGDTACGRRPELKLSAHRALGRGPPLRAGSASRGSRAAPRGAGCAARGWTRVAEAPTAGSFHRLPRL